MANVNQLVAEFGEYFEAAGQNEQDLITHFKQPSETEQLFPLGLATVGPNMSTIVKKSTVETSRILQPFQKDWTPLGGATFKPKSIELFRFKIDIDETPDDLVNSWAGFLTSNNLDRATWPFAKWLAYEYLTNQHKEDRELLEIFQGVFVAPTAGTPGAAGTGMDGIRKQIRNHYATGDSAVIPLGAVPTDEVDFCEYIEQFTAGIPELVRTRSGASEIVMNQTLRDRYKEGKRKKYNLQYGQVNDLTTVMHKENFSVKGVASHAGSDLIWFAPKFNKNRFMVAQENEGIFKVESAKRKVNMFTDYFFGVGFWVSQYLYHNDRDLV